MRTGGGLRRSRHDAFLLIPLAHAMHVNRGGHKGRPYSGNVGALLHSENTNSIVWLRISRSSGVRMSLPLEIWLSPDMIATYCLPPASNVIGGALKPLPTLIFHSCSRLVARFN